MFPDPLIHRINVEKGHVIPYGGEFLLSILFFLIGIREDSHVLFV